MNEAATRNIPAELRALPQWVNWQIETRDGRPTKIPKQPDGKNASSTERRTWNTYYVVDNAPGELGTRVGFVFTKEDGYVGIDLDKCRNVKTGETEEWALRIIAELDSYTELSQSGTGWHIIVKGKLPDTGRHPKDSRLEMYDHSRYFTFTGILQNGLGQRTIEERDLTGLHKRMMDKEFVKTAAPGPRTVGDKSAEDFRLISTIQKQFQTDDADIIESGLKEKYPDYVEDRNRVKGKRDGKTYIRYTIERFIKRMDEPHGMILSDNGKIKPLLANAIVALRRAPEWRGVIGMNEFSLSTTTRAATPWGKPPGEKWLDNDDIRTSEWLQHHGILVTPTVAANAVQVIADENRFHPVKDYLKSITWDRTPRIDTWLTDYMGAQDTPFNNAIGRRWLISAIARIMQPGCQADHTLLLEGPQGIKKSTALKMLTGAEWFTDHISNFDSKDSRLELLGKWIIELAELAVTRKSDVEKVKAFLTATADNFRPPYGRRTVQVPRTNVFAASVNDDSPFTDETGNRRFWPVKCGNIYANRIDNDRDQLWAEALQAYKDGYPWWLETPDLVALATGEQAYRYAAGVWDSTIEPYLESRVTNEVTVAEILANAIKKPLETWNHSDKITVSKCLKINGWKQVVVFRNGITLRVYRKPDITAEP
jgi:predicted P-loop ATPase